VHRDRGLVTSDRRHNDRPDVECNCRVIGVAMLLIAIAVGWTVGPKWWHWGSFIVLTLVLFVPLMMAFFVPLPIVIILNVAISHAG